MFHSRQTLTSLNSLSPIISTPSFEYRSKQTKSALKVPYERVPVSFSLPPAMVLVFRSKLKAFE
jgi:hypothetical protein